MAERAKSTDFRVAWLLCPINLSVRARGICSLWNLDPEVKFGMAKGRWVLDPDTLELLPGWRS
jgi:hypothetical protein